MNYIDAHESAFSFFGNIKRYKMVENTANMVQMITSSNIKPSKAAYQVNYDSVINRKYKYFDNSTIMLLNLLRRIGVSKITFAGFDGFDERLVDNYMDVSFQNDRRRFEFMGMNIEIKRMLKDIKETLRDKCQFTFITPSIFELA